MIRKSISNLVNNSVWAILGDMSLPKGKKAGETWCPCSLRPTTSAHPSSRCGMDPFIQAGKRILGTVSQQFKRKSCLWFATLDPHCSGTHFQLPAHPSSTDLTSKTTSEPGKTVWYLIYATERKTEVGGDSSSWSALKNQGESIAIQMEFHRLVNPLCPRRSESVSL